RCFVCIVFRDTATTSFSPLSLHDALPISAARRRLLVIAGVAPDDRLFVAPLLAFIVVIHEGTLGADDAGAAIAIRFVAVLADQRADPRLLELDQIGRAHVLTPVTLVSGMTSSACTINISL